MCAPDAAGVVRAWTARIVLGVAGIALLLLVGAGTSHAESPIGLGQVAGSVTKPVRAATKPVPAAIKPVRTATNRATRAKPVKLLAKRVDQSRATKRVAALSNRGTVPRIAKNQLRNSRHPIKPVRTAPRPHRIAAKPLPQLRHRVDRIARPAKNAAGSTATAAKRIRLAQTVRSTASSSIDQTIRVAINQVTSKVPKVTSTVPKVAAVVPEVASVVTEVASLVPEVTGVISAVAQPLTPVLDEVETLVPRLLPPKVPAVVDPSPTSPVPTLPMAPAVPTVGLPTNAVAVASSAATGALPADLTAPPTQLRQPEWAAAAARPTTEAAQAGSTSLAPLGTAITGLVAAISKSLGLGAPGAAGSGSTSVVLLALIASASLLAGLARSPMALPTFVGAPFRRPVGPGFSPD